MQEWVQKHVQTEKIEEQPPMPDVNQITPAVFQLSPEKVTPPQVPRTPQSKATLLKMKEMQERDAPGRQPMS